MIVLYLFPASVLFYIAFNQMTVLNLCPATDCFKSESTPNEVHGRYSTGWINSKSSYTTRSHREGCT